MNMPAPGALGAATFRHRLRRATRPEHDATERAFAPFLDDPKTNLGWFLSAQRAGLGVLRASASDAAGLLSGETAGRLIRRLDHDLARLGRTFRAVPGGQALDPLAVDYLILGSMLGTETMRRQHFLGWNPADVPSYFQVYDDGPLWRKHCAMLDEIDPDSPRAAALIEWCKSGFILFGQAADLQDKAGNDEFDG